MNLVQLIDVNKFFGKKQVLQNVSFNINIHDIITIIGPNGAGKTTLVKILLGALKPDSGKVIKKPNINICYIPQKLSVDPILPFDVNSFLKTLINRKINAHELSNVLEKLGLRNILNTSIHNLSGGEFRKILFIPALLNQPDLVVLDEATSGLDVNAQAEFYSLIEEVRKNKPCGVIMVSHDLYTVMKSSAKVICLNTHICCEGKPNDIKLNPEYIKIFGTYSHNHDHSH